jgi:sulfotransferase family protein
MTKKAKPDFICIGPTKTGTSWLHISLNKLPQVDMPRAKELRFYWGLGDPRKRFVDTPVGGIEKRLGKMNLKWRRKYLGIIKKRIKTGEDKLAFQSIVWDLKYILFPQTITWYQSLFAKNKISGDIDGGYYYFDEEVISRIRKHVPGVKIILILREPVERHWSQLRMWAYHLRGVDLATKTEDQIVRRFRKILNDTPAYSDVVKLWRKNFSEEQFYIAYYDDLKKNPREYFDRICDFLGLDRAGPEVNGLDKVVFEGTPFPMPLAAERVAHQMLYADLKKLVKLVDSEYPKNWLNAMENRIRILRMNEK